MSYLLCFYISKAKVRLVAICSTFSLLFEGVPAVVCLLALLQAGSGDDHRMAIVGISFCTESSLTICDACNDWIWFSSD